MAQPARADGPTPADSSARHRRPEKLAESIARDIVEDIVKRDLQAGAMLPSEVEMSDAYGVGRASIREALRILEVQGLVTIRPGRGGGPMVNEVSAQTFGRMATLHFKVARATFSELIEARLALEPMMAGLAATRRNPETVEALKRAVGTTHTAIASEDSDSYIEGATSFHSVIAGVSGNRILDLVGESLRIIYAGRVVRFIYPQSHRHMVAASHEEIADAIIKGRSRIAEELMREHMHEYTAQLRERFPELLDEVVDWR